MAGISPNEQWWSQQFNTALPNENQFQSWAQRLGRNPALESIDYDLRGMYAAQQGFADNGHGSDMFKKPNHPTFSQESQYSGSPTPSGGQYVGGYWSQPNALMMALGRISPDTRPSFTASPQMMQQTHNQPDMQAYMSRYEPSYDLLMPYPPYRQEGRQLSNYFGF